jgi:hypothetical protein
VSGGEWVLLSAGLAVLISGVVLCAGIASRGGGSSRRARGILAQRYAAGEISTEELNERRDALGRASARGMWPLAVALMSTGLVVTVVTLIFAPDWSVMGGAMMGGDMGPMMGGGAAMRDAPAPRSEGSRRGAAHASGLGRPIMSLVPLDEILLRRRDP